MIKNYIFDLGNVVLILDWNKVIDKYCEEEKYKKILNDVVFESLQWQKLDEGTVTKEEAIKEMKKNLPENLHDFCDCLMEHWTEGLIINYEMLNIISKLRSKGFNTYILSNAPLDIPIFLKENDLLKYFDDNIISAEINMLKPNRQIYEYALNKFKINAEDTMFIDDKYENVEAAKAIGINGVQFDYKNINDFKNILQLTSETF